MPYPSLPLKSLFLDALLLFFFVPLLILTLSFFKKRKRTKEIAAKKNIEKKKEEWEKEEKKKKICSWKASREIGAFLFWNRVVGGMESSSLFL